MLRALAYHADPWFSDSMDARQFWEDLTNKAVMNECIHVFETCEI